MNEEQKQELLKRSVKNMTIIFGSDPKIKVNVKDITKEAQIHILDELLKYIELEGVGTVKDHMAIMKFMLR